MCTSAEGAAHSAALYRLMTWLSPAYPVGAFSYSHGLEYAVEAGLLSGAESTRAWIADTLEFGAARNDGVFLACAHRAARRREQAALAELTELAAAHVATAELALETRAQGEAFLSATRRAWPSAALDWLPADRPVVYPVAVGVAAAGHGIAVEATLLAYLSAFAANLTSAAQRLVPLGQRDGQAIIAALEPLVVTLAAALREASTDQLGGAAMMIEHCSMQHETQYTRLFRS